MFENISFERFQNEIIIYEKEFSIGEKTRNEFICRINEFSEKMDAKNQSTEYWQNNRNTNKKKAKMDNKIGKHGELGLYVYLLNRCNFPKVSVDRMLEVREGYNKEWDPDLPFNEQDDRYPNCHVKTCDERTKNLVKKLNDKYSWSLQYANKSGKGGKDPLFSGKLDDDVMMLMYTPFYGSEQFTLIASSPWGELRPLLKDPVLDHLKGIKKCLYFNDIKEASTNKCVATN